MVLSNLFHCEENLEKTTLKNGDQPTNIGSYNLQYINNDRR